MAATSKPPRMTFKEYIAWEEQQETRHEFFDGEVYPVDSDPRDPRGMAGGSLEHSFLVSAVHLAVGAQLAGSKCRAVVENMRVRGQTGKVSYPDVLVICPPFARDPEDEKGTVTNPRVIIEVLSESTELYDRTKKFAHYRSMESLVEYVLVASYGTPAIERFLKNGEGVWTIGPAVGVGETMKLSSVDVTLDVDAIYSGLIVDGAVRVAEA